MKLSLRAGLLGPQDFCPSGSSTLHFPDMAWLPGVPRWMRFALARDLQLGMSKSYFDCLETPSSWSGAGPEAGLERPPWALLHLAVVTCEVSVTSGSMRLFPLQ